MHHLHDVHPDDLSRLTTAQLRDRFLFQSLFVSGEQRLCYWDVDRTVFGGLMPTDAPITLSTPANLAAACFCERRELGIINLGGPGYVIVGEEKFEMAPRDGLYVGRGAGIFIDGSVESGPILFAELSGPRGLSDSAHEVRGFGRHSSG